MAQDSAVDSAEIIDLKKKIALLRTEFDGKIDVILQRVRERNLAELKKRITQ